MSAQRIPPIVEPEDLMQALFASMDRTHVREYIWPMVVKMTEDWLLGYEVSGKVRELALAWREEMSESGTEARP